MLENISSKLVKNLTLLIFHVVVIDSGSFIEEFLMFSELIEQIFNLTVHYLT
jgi:hypothetical protein